MTNWEQVQIDYENGMTLKELAMKYKEKTNTIKGRRYREKWKKLSLDSNDITDKDIDDCIDDSYEKGYSPKDIKNLINHNSFREYMDMETIRGVAKDFARDSILIEDEDTPEYAKELNELIEKYTDELISDKAIEEMIGEVVSEHIIVGLGKKRKVQIKYNSNGKIINKTITNIQPTKEERESAIEILLKLHSYRSNNDDTHSAYGYKV